MLGPSPETHAPKKMSHDQSAVSGEIETGKMPTGAFEIGADRVGVDPKEAKAAEIQTAIADKTKQAAGLRATWKEKFNAFKALKAEEDEQRSTVQRLKIAGKLNLSDEDIKQGERDSTAKLEEALNDAQKYRSDAEELEAEIEALNAELGKDRN